MIESYNDVAKYLEKQINPKFYEKISVGSNDQDDPLARMRHFLKLLGNPQESFLSVVISGTSGKGSTSYLIAQILATAGFEVGLTQSPHLQKINERIQINQNGRPSSITDKSLASLLKDVLPTIQLMQGSQYGSPTYFEILFGMAMLYFKQQNVRVAIVEVGLEGKFDATNAINPALFILTNISFDHTAILGSTITEIADEATYRIKSLKKVSGNNPVVITSATQLSVRRLIRRRALESGSKVLEHPANFICQNVKHNQNGVYFDFCNKKHQNKPLSFYVSLRGDYQAVNTTLAIETTMQLQKYGIVVQTEDARLALKTAFFPGRYEALKCGQTTCILDGAHNPAKMSAFLSSLKADYDGSKKIFLLAFKKDKNISEMLRQVDKEANAIILTQFSSSTDTEINAGIDVRKLYSLARLNTKSELIVEPDCTKAFNMALVKVESAAGGIVVVTGSLYLVGQIRDYLGSTEL